MAYKNPVPTVDIIIRVKGGIILIERKNPPFGWALPGGFVDYGEKFKGLLSSGSTVFTCRPVADNKQYVASLHAGHKKGVISVRDRTQFPTSKI